MITYNPAFDLYHSIYRMAHIVDRLDVNECMEIDKARIWDFYMLFPDKVYNITIRRDEDYLRQLREGWIQKENNPYEYRGDNRKLFEWIKPVQLSALGCLVSCGILDKGKYEEGCVCLMNKDVLKEFLAKAGKESTREYNVLSFMGSLSRNMPLTGQYGLKARTRLLESKYDSE